MLLREVLDPPVQADQVEPTSGDFQVNVGGSYIFSPIAVRDKDEELHHLLTVYSPDEDEIKTYSIGGTDPIIFEVIRSDFPVEDTRIVRVQILSDVDAIVDKYDAEAQELIKEDGEVVTIKLKQIPDFDNYDLFSDDTFEERFGRRRKPYEHGLIGYLYLDKEPQPADEFNQTDVGAGQDVLTSYDTDLQNKNASNVYGNQHALNAARRRRGGGAGGAGHKFNDKSDFDRHAASKMQRAIALYKSNGDMPRTHVIKLIMRHLDMTRAGASSYYTKAMHAVEDELKNKATSI